MYGPVRTVVWQGSAGDRRPYADQVPFLESGISDVCLGTTVGTAQTTTKRVSASESSVARRLETLVAKGQILRLRLYPGGTTKCQARKKTGSRR